MKIGLRVQYLKSKVFKRFILSYIAVFVIALFFWMLLYNNIIRSLSDSMVDTTMNNINQVRDILDINLEGLNYIAIQLPENKNLASMIYTQDTRKLSEYQFYVLVRELKNYRASNAFLDNVYVYFRNSDIIVSADGKYSLDIFYDKVCRYTSMFQSDYEYLLNSVNDYTYLPIERIYSISSQKEMLTCLVPIPISGDIHSVTLIFTVNGSSIKRIINNIMDMYEGAVYVLDQKNNVISASGDKKINISDNKVVEFLAGYGTNSVRQETIDGEKHIILSTRSGKSGWGFVAILPLDQVLQEVIHIRTLSVWIMGLSIFFSMLLACYFSYKNYYPINKTINSLRSYVSGESDNQPGKEFAGNEFELIERSLSQIINTNKAMKNQIVNQLSIVRSDFIKKLLRGEYTDCGSIRNMAHFIEMDSLSGPFSVMVFQIDDYEEFVGKNSKEIQSAYRFAVANVIEELSQSFGAGYVTAEKEEVVLLVDHKGKDTDHNDEIKSFARKILDFFRENFDFTLTAGIGGLYESLVDISKAYVEASLSVDYKMINGKNTVILYKDLVTKKFEGTGYFYSLQNEEKIMTCLNIGDFEGIHQVITSTIESIKRNHVDIRVARCIYFEIINSAMKALGKLTPADYNEIVMEGNILPTMIQCETLDELNDHIVEFYRILCERISVKKEKANQDLGEKILKYIHDNYTDSNISLTMISQMFDVTPAYLSRFFKNYVRCNFVDYLHRLRIKKAIQLLSGTEDNINNIAIRCGYLDSHGLIRAFKKYEKITPGKYRESAKSTG